MAEYSAGNSAVGEDWESECYEPVASSAVLQTRATLEVCSPSVYVSSEHDDVSGFRDSSSSSDVDSKYDMTEQRTDEPIYVTDSKKVFVTNINYRVSFVAC